MGFASWNFILGIRAFMESSGKAELSANLEVNRAQERRDKRAKVRRERSKVV